MTAPAGEVLIYSTSWCGFCERARGLLRRKGVEFREVRLDETPDEREVMMSRSGGRRSVPQIFIGDHHVGGYDELAALDHAGELDQLLGRG
jgi:glutaredoxin 3